MIEILQSDRKPAYRLKRRKSGKTKIVYNCRCCKKRSAGSWWRLFDGLGLIRRPLRWTRWRGVLWLQGWSYSTQPAGWYCPTCSVTFDESRTVVALRGSTRPAQSALRAGTGYPALHAIARVHLAMRRVLRGG